MNELWKEVIGKKVRRGALAMWWTGQAGYIFKTSSQTIVMIDTYLSGKADASAEWGRLAPAPFSPDDIACHIYIATHDHADHLDHAVVAKVARNKKILFAGPRFVARAYRKLGVAGRQICEINVGETKKLKDITLTGTFAIPCDERSLDTAGYLLATSDGITVYHTSDTAYTEFLGYLARYPIDLLLVCIAGKYGIMGCEDAARLARLLRPRVVIPNHYGMFALNNEDPQRFRGILAATGTEPECKLLEPGQCYDYRQPEITSRAG
jgi:L-ascorbate 6-phosphate lactonase